MRKILLDCGAHFGKGLRKQIEINKIDPSWKIYSWEANPYTYKHFITIDRFKHLDIIAYHAAVSDSEGTIKFNIQSSTDRQGNITKSGTGSSAMSLDEWQCKGGGFVEEVEVKKIDLSKWMSDNLIQSDYVILKMDIEGSEYPVLEKIINSGLIKLIDKLYIEWHSNMFADPTSYKSREELILLEFQKNNIPVENW
jgi:FkbM family methyltransferase